MEEDDTPQQQQPLSASNIAVGYVRGLWFFLERPFRQPRL